MRVRESSGSGRNRQDLAHAEQLPTQRPAAPASREQPVLSAEQERHLLARWGCALPAACSWWHAQMGCAAGHLWAAPAPHGSEPSACGGHRAALGAWWLRRSRWPSQPSIRSADALQGLQIRPSVLGNKVVSVWKRVHTCLRWPFLCCPGFIQRQKFLRAEFKSHSQSVARLTLLAEYKSTCLLGLWTAVENHVFSHLQRFLLFQTENFIFSVRTRARYSPLVKTAVYDGVVHR